MVPRIASHHRKRLTKFSIIGFSIFALGLCLQALLVRIIHLPAVPAYVIQLVLSVESNFLANYRWTWSDRHAPFWRAWRRYNLKRTAGVLFSLAVYPLLIKLGMNYLIANGLLVAVLTPTNYVLGHLWTFASKDRPAETGQSSEDHDVRLEYQ
jgi:putative flippase GtrA